MKQIKINIYSFEPVINNVSEVLILGSIPGKISLEKKEYYGNNRNKSAYLL
jgi:TDG/mug DNA glycosylase family protein